MFKRSSINQSELDAQSNAKNALCKTHAQHFEYYCEDKNCNCFICQECTDIDHRGHALRLMKFYIEDRGKNSEVEVKEIDKFLKNENSEIALFTQTHTKICAEIQKIRQDSIKEILNFQQILIKEINEITENTLTDMNKRLVETIKNHKEIYLQAYKIREIRKNSSSAAEEFIMFLKKFDDDNKNAEKYINKGLDLIHLKDLKNKFISHMIKNNYEKEAILNSVKQNNFNKNLDDFMDDKQEFDEKINKEMSKIDTEKIKDEIELRYKNQEENLDKVKNEIKRIALIIRSLYAQFVAKQKEANIQDNDNEIRSKLDKLDERIKNLDQDRIDEENVKKKPSLGAVMLLKNKGDIAIKPIIEEAKIPKELSSPNSKKCSHTKKYKLWSATPFSKKMAGKCHCCETMLLNGEEKYVCTECNIILCSNCYKK